MQFNIIGLKTLMKNTNSISFMKPFQKYISNKLIYFYDEFLILEIIVFMELIS